MSFLVYNYGVVSSSKRFFKHCCDEAQIRLMKRPQGTAASQTTAKIGSSRSTEEVGRGHPLVLLVTGPAVSACVLMSLQVARREQEYAKMRAQIMGNASIDKN